MKAIKYWLLLLSLTVIVSCNNSEKKDDTNSQSEENNVTQTTSKFNNLDPALSAQLNQVVQHYIHLKNALVKSDSKEAKAGADGIIAALNSVDSTKFTNEQKTEYSSSIAKINAGAKAVSESLEIEKQRESFNSVTEGMYSLAKSFSLGKQLFYQYCPMANNSNGGYWISETEEVNNPYFGDEMLHCGEVKETLK